MNADNSPAHVTVLLSDSNTRVLRRSTVVVIAIVRNRSCDATTAATMQRRGSSQPHALSLALSETRGTTAATVQRRRSSQPHAPSLALSGTRGTTAATVHRRRSSQPHAPSLALSGTRDTTAATVQRRSSSQALYRHATSDCCSHLAGPSHRQPSLSRTRPLRSDFSRTIWRCRCSPSRRDRNSRRRRQ